MRLLLDTHTFLWAMTEPKKLSHAAQRMVENARNAIFISSVSLLEISIKRAGGTRKGPPVMTAQQAFDLGRAAGYEFLDMRPSHAVAVETLPLIHSDPYDRLLVAQAMVEKMYLLTHDEILSGYGESVILF
jgi:PIN domain nuclease of toxin-antitoxin system